MYGKLQHALTVVEQETAFQNAQVHMSAIMTISHIFQAKPLHRLARAFGVWYRHVGNLRSAYDHFKLVTRARKRELLSSIVHRWQSTSQSGRYRAFSLWKVVTHHLKQRYLESQIALWSVTHASTSCEVVLQRWSQQAVARSWRKLNKWSLSCAQLANRVRMQTDLRHSSLRAANRVLCHALHRALSRALRQWLSACFGSSTKPWPMQFQQTFEITKEHLSSVSEGLKRERDHLSTHAQSLGLTVMAKIMGHGRDFALSRAWRKWWGSCTVHALAASIRELEVLQATEQQAHAAEMDKLDDRHTADRRQLERELEEGHREAQRQLQLELSQRHREEQESIHHRHRTESLELTESHQATVAELEERHSVALRGLDEANAAKVTRLEERYNTASGRLEEAHSEDLQGKTKELEGLRADLRLQSLRTTNRVVCHALHRGLSRAFRQWLGSYHVHQMTEHRRRASLTWEEKEAKIEEIAGEVNALKAAHAGELSEHQQRASATWEEKEAELRRITSEMEAIKVTRGEHFASAQLETTRHAEQARGLEGELREYEQAQEGFLESLQNQHDELAALREAHAEDLSWRARQHEDALEATIRGHHESHDEALDALRAAHSQEKEEWAKAHSARLEAHEETISSMRAMHAHERAAWARTDSGSHRAGRAMVGLRRWLDHDRRLNLRRSLQQWRLCAHREGHSTAAEGLIGSLIAQHAECEALKIQHKEDVAYRNQRHAEDVLIRWQKSHRGSKLRRGFHTWRVNGGYAFYEMGVRLSTYEQAMLTMRRATVVQNRGCLHYAFTKLYASTCMSLANETAQAIVKVILPLVIRFRVQCAISVHAAFMRLLLHGAHEFDSPGVKPAAEGTKNNTPKVGRTRAGTRDSRRRRTTSNGTRSAARSPGSPRSPLPSQTKGAFDLWRQGDLVAREEEAGAHGGGQPRCM
mmetsp:Transcript_68565/g.190835  ORF Transcript_68565/g.190835 Transcript_68565/m.190835 type:complete len:933 (+) Transcript_68565:941-3739(+)